MTVSRPTLVSLIEFTMLSIDTDVVKPSSESFASLLNIDSVTWKQKKFTLDDFSKALESDLETSVRYDTLYITSDINVKWNASTGEFKFSGSYGKMQQGL